MVDSQLQVWVAPLTFIMCLYMLYLELGVACFTSVAVMAAMTFPQKILFDKYLKKNSDTMRLRDQRVKVHCP